MGELMSMREQYMRKRSKGCVCSFSVADRLPLSMIYFVVHEAEKKRDEFWQMMCVEMVGDVVGMRLPHDILRRLYQLGVKYDDWNIRSVVAMRRELSRDLFGRMLSDPEDEVRRHFIIAHKNDRLSCIKIAYLETLAADMVHNVNRDYAKYAMKEAVDYLSDAAGIVRLAALKMLTCVSAAAWRSYAKSLTLCLFDKSIDVRLQAHVLLGHVIRAPLSQDWRLIPRRGPLKAEKVRHWPSV